MRISNWLLGAALLCAGAPAMAQSKVYKIAFTDYCDGMQLTVTDKVFVVGKSTGCYAGNIDEGFSGKVESEGLLIVSSTNSGGSAAWTYVIDTKSMTWALYATADGVTQSVLSSGSYTKGNPPAGRNLPATGRRTK